MKFVGIDLHTNRFLCCYLSDNSKEKQTETFEINPEGLKMFYSTIGNKTYILIEATINKSLHKALRRIFSRFCFPSLTRSLIFLCGAVLYLRLTFLLQYWFRTFSLFFLNLLRLKSSNTGLFSIKYAVLSPLPLLNLCCICCRIYLSLVFLIK